MPPGSARLTLAAPGRLRPGRAPGLHHERPARLPRSGLGLSEDGAFVSSGLWLRRPGPESWDPASQAAQPLSPHGSGRPGVGGAPGEAGGAARRSFVRRNGLFAVPGVGEDEPVIIFKFAIIDLGKSYCDKNELIIKFISKINSGAIKQLAGDGGAAGGSGLRSRQVPAPKPGSLCRRTGWGAGAQRHLLSVGPFPGPHRGRPPGPADSVLRVEGQKTPGA